MRREHWITISGFLLLFACIYLGCDTKSQETKALEKSRTLNFETINIQNLRDAALENLGPDKKQQFIVLSQQMNMESDDSLQTNLLMKIAGFWYENAEILLSGHYAQKIAEKEPTEQAWSIAGTTYLIALKEVDNDAQKKYAMQHAVDAFEKAISINPDNIDNKINLALCYVENPSEENPMMGIQQLLSLNQDNPDNVAVILQLARLGMQTGQWDKAIGRLEKALQLDPENMEVICMLASAYGGKGDSSNADKYRTLCQN